MKIRISNYKLACLIYEIIKFVDFHTFFRGTGFFKMEAEQVYKECDSGIQIDNYYLITWGKEEKK